MEDGLPPPPPRRLPPAMSAPFVPPPPLPAATTPRDRPPPMPRTPGSRPTSLWQETLDEHREIESDGDVAAGIGGWLVVIAIGRVIAIPITLYKLARLASIYLKPGLWGRLTTPGSANYHPLWAGTIFYELGGEVFILLWCIVLALLFFLRKKSFPLVYVCYSLVLIAFVWGDQYLAATVLGKGGYSPSPEQFAKLIGSSIGTVIWVPYFFMSERVRTTFVR